MVGGEAVRGTVESTQQEENNHPTLFSTPVLMRMARNRAGVVVTRSFGLDDRSPMHIVDFCSHKLRRVARSTKAAGTLAGSEGYDRGFYCRAVVEWIESTLLKGMLLVLDNSSLYADVSTTRAPKEKLLKVNLAFLREVFEGGELSGVICVMPWRGWSLWNV